MGSSTIQELTDTEGEIIRLLVEVGLKTNEARVLVVFFRGKEMTSRDIERIADLRQPEVSVAITCLSKRRWVYVSNLITENKGRPVKLFDLKESVDEILDELRDGICAGHEQQMVLLGKIREILYQGVE
jgi:predicted transcriptional regulator